MDQREQARLIVISGILLASLIGSGIVLAGNSAAQSADITVAPDENGDDSSIQNAVDNAGENDRVEVRPGNYQGNIVIDKNINLIAPDGATISGSDSDEYGIQIAPDIAVDDFDGDYEDERKKIRDPVSPLIKGFVIEGHSDGILVGGNLFNESTGDWVVQNVTIRDTDSEGIETTNGLGDWRIVNSRIADTDFYGINADGATGQWSVEDTIISRTDRGGIRAVNTESQWQVVNTTVQNTSAVGITASFNSADWIIRNTTVSNNTGGTRIGGIDVQETSGDWSIIESRIENNSGVGVGLDPIDRGIDPVTGNWTITESRIVGNQGGVDAQTAATAGNVTRNYWGASSGPSGDFTGAGDAAAGKLSVIPFYSDVSLNDLSSQIETTESPLSKVDGKGTENSPYVITNVSELQAMEDDLDGNYILGNNIDASETSRWNSKRGFDPVGEEPFVFTGSLNGNGYKITNLTINRQNASRNAGEYSNQGLFGKVYASNDSAAVISYISLTNVSVYGGNAVGGIAGTVQDKAEIKQSFVHGTINGSREVGGLVGTTIGSESTIKQSHANIYITGNNDVGGIVGNSNSRIINSSATGTVTGTNPDGYLSGDNVGGLVGANEGLITASAMAGHVTSTGNGVGGLIGDNSGSITESYSTAGVAGNDYVGGLVGVSGGFDNATIKNAYATGSVTGNSSVGGLVGLNYADLSSVEARVNSTYAAGSVTGNSTVGGLIGESDDGIVYRSYWDEQATGQSTSAGTATGLTTDEMTGQAAQTNMTGLTFGSVWDSRSNQYPVLVSPPETDDRGSDGSTLLAPSVGTPADDVYDPTSPLTIVTYHNATGVINASNVALRFINTTNNNTAQIALNDSVPVKGEANTTIPTNELSGDVTLEIQLYNISNSTAVANNTLNLTTVDLGNAAPYLGVPSDDIYDPTNSLTLGTYHNATGVINESDVALKYLNATNGNNTQIALNDSVSLKGDVNTTIPAGNLSGDVTVKIQLYNTSTDTVEASSETNLTANRVKNLNTSSSFVSLQTAIDNASTGDTLEIRHDLTLDRRVTVDKDGLTITSSGDSNRPTLRAQEEVGLIVTADKTLIEQIALQTKTANETGDVAGILAPGTQNTEIRDTSVTVVLADGSSDSPAGVVTGANTSITESTFIAEAEGNIPGDSSIRGIHIYENHTEVRNNSFQGPFSRAITNAGSGVNDVNVSKNNFTATSTSDARIAIELTSTASPAAGNNYQITDNRFISYPGPLYISDYEDMTENISFNRNYIENAEGAAFSDGNAVFIGGTVEPANATRNWWGSSDGPSGIGSGSGARIGGDLNYEPYYVDQSLETLSGDGTETGETTVDKTNSSITPATVQADDTYEFRVNVTLTNTSLTDDDSGELDVRADELDTDATNDTTFEYDGSNLTDGRLTVSKNVIVTIPRGTNNITLNVTDLRRDTGDDGVEYLLEDRQLQVDTLVVTEGPDQVELDLSANRADIQAGQPVEFTLTNESGSGLVGNVSVEGSSTEGETDTNGTVVFSPTQTGSLTVVGTKPDTSDAVYFNDTIVIESSLAAANVTTETVAFGRTPLESTATTSVTVDNPNPANITVTAAASGDFNVAAGDGSQTIPADSNRTVNVTYAPSDRNDDAGTLSLETVEINQVFDVPLNGTGVAPAPRITDEPEQLRATAGDTDNTTITLANDGNAELNASLTVADPFTVTSSTDISVDAGSTRTIDIGFAPDDSTAQSVNRELTIAPDSSAAENLTETVSGTVEESSIDVVRDSIDFGNITNETTQQVTVTNTGTTSVESLSVSTTSENFTVDSTTVGLDASGIDAERLLTVRSNLSAGGQATGELQINGSTAAENASVDLTATRITPTLSLGTAEPVTINTTAGTRSTKYIPITNDGTAALVVEIESFNTSEQDAGFDSTASGETLRIPAGETDSISVRFSRDDAENQTATLAIDTNDEQATNDAENITVTANVSAAATEAELNSPRTQNFETIGINATASNTFTVSYGFDGDLDLNVTDISLNGATDVFAVNATEADLGNGENITLSDGDETEFNAIYTPDAETTQTATVTITGSVGGNSTTASTTLVGSGRAPELAATQGRLRFGAVETGNTSSESLTLNNTGPEGTTLNVTTLDVAAPFDSSGSVNVSGGESETIDISFKPGTNDIGEFSDTVTLRIDGPLRTTNRTVRLTATGTGPEPTLSVEQLDIGSLSVNNTVNRTATIENTGGVPFDVDISDSTDQTDDPVTVSDVIGPNRLVPGEERTVVLTIAPDEASDVGSLNAGVTIATEQSGVNDTLRVTGTVTTPNATVATSDIDFDDTPTGSASQQTVTVNNTGNATLRVAESTLSGSNESAFGIVSGDQQLRVAPDSEEPIAVSFAPKTTGTKTANLTIEPLNDPDTSNTTVQLTGTGTDADAGISPTSIEFSDVDLGETASTQVTISNDGNAPLNITSVATPSAFSVPDLSADDTIAANSEVDATVEVNTTNTGRGALTGTLSIGTNDTTLSSTLGARAVAPKLATTSTTTEFQTTRLGTTTLETVVVENDGNAPLILNEATITGANGPGFTVLSNPADRTLAPSETGRYTVRFDPSAVSDPVVNAQGTESDRTAEATLTVETQNESVSSFNATLEGEAVTPAVKLDRRTIRFPETAIGETLTRNVTVTNDATNASAPVNITGASISGTASQAYNATVNGTAPVTLTSGESQRVEVALSPDSTGAKYATLSIETNDSRQPVKKVGLSNKDTVYSVEYGSVIVNYFNPTDGAEPTADVDAGLQERNASLSSVRSTANTSNDYRLDFSYSSTTDDTLSENVDNATAVQYIDATENAENFKQSTFEIEVSKATLAATDDTPENVSIYHETSTGSYEKLDTTLLFETTKGYVYEVTTDSYSIFAVGVPDSSSSEDTTEDTTDDTTDDGGGVPEVQPETDPQIENIVIELEETEPTSRTTTTIEDSAPEQAGVTIEPEETTAVKQITFVDEQLGGSVDITEYTEPPAQVAEEISSTVATDVSLSADGESGDQTETDGGSDANINVISVSDISPSSEDATETAATVTLTVDADDIENQDNTFVVHETTDGWERLDTRVEDTGGDEITLTAETSSFSLFAVVEAGDESAGQTDTETDGDQQSESADGTEESDSGPGVGTLIGVGIVIALLAVTAVAYRRRQ